MELEFLSTPSARRATRSHIVRVVFKDISIHALREEGDACVVVVGPQGKQFLSTPSARRATPLHLPCEAGVRISIHALREEGDHAGASDTNPALKFLSTPSARRATNGGLRLKPLKTFLSTPSARRATRSATVSRTTTVFLSTPSARRATVFRKRRQDASIYFYPRPPRGGRPAAHDHWDWGEKISIHALREEGD